MIEELAVKIVTYHETFISALFVTGFTIGSFLFSMKAMIVKTLKEEVYDHDIYQDEVCQRIATGSDEGFYDNLSNFSSLLMKAIVWSFISAICQITLGAIGCWLSSIVCLLVAFISWMYLAFAINAVHNNWGAALVYANEVALKKNKANINKHKKSPFD